MLQTLQRDEEAVFVPLSKHTGYGMTEGISHMRKDAEPGLSSLHLASWDEHNLPCHLTQPVCATLFRSCCSPCQGSSHVFAAGDTSKSKILGKLWQTRCGQHVMLLLMC